MELWAPDTVVGVEGFGAFCSYRRKRSATRLLSLRTTIVVLVFPRFARRKLPSNPINTPKVSKVSGGRRRIRTFDLHNVSVAL